jgi:hypothetical protein
MTTRSAFKAIWADADIALKAIEEVTQQAGRVTN